MNPELQSMLDQLEAIKVEGKAVAAGLSDAQFNWHPGKDRWSIADCLQHLNVAVAKTLPAFDQAIGEGRAKEKRSPGPFRYGWFSRWMVASMEPPPKWRMKTPPILRVPASATYRLGEVLPEFTAARDRLAERVRQSDGLDLAHIKTISPVNRLLRLPLGAYFGFLIAHDRRHLWQARQVRSASGFPAS
ncbi:MAG TPA: DinB family protein [Gemmatimonadales bacterium]|nr:DinB family protein [Gemmatimonadales bacterium]